MRIATFYSILICFKQNQYNCIDSFRLCGYANALVFGKITDDDIKYVEAFMRDELMTLVLQNESETLNKSDQNSFVDQEDILFDDEQRLEYFGKVYAKHPDKFKFQLGDLRLINELVTYVRRVVNENGLHVFKPSITTKKATKKLAQKSTNTAVKKSINRKRKPNTSTPHSSSIETNTEDLKLDLMQRLKVCLYAHRANHVFHLDLENDIHEDTVQITMTNGDVNGTIRCIICDKESRPKNEPKHIHYSAGSKNPCWVLSNYTTHLKRQHSLIFHKIDADSANTNVVNSPENDEILPDQKQDASVVCLNESFQVATKSTEEVDAISSMLYTQLSGQIAHMMTVALQNSDSQEQMYFNLTDNAPKKLTIATIAKDGNCLFSALAHQLEQHRINGKAHKSATEKLRHDVCEYILNNYSSFDFAHHLKNRVYELKNKKDIDNVDRECKLFVSLYLRQNGNHGGAETVHAVSQMKKVNIVVFNEDGPCHMPANINENYNRTVCLAYQRARNEKGEVLSHRNHYGSVCDINSAILYDAARIIANN